MSRLVFNPKNIFKQSIFGALFVLWTAPIDGSKLDVSKADKSANVLENMSSINLIVGYKS